jgi:hypothetical protein
MTLSSSAWILVIVLGAGIVALGNIGYGLASDKEKATSASQKALSMLAKESERNLVRLHEMQKMLAQNQVTIEGFEIAAWNVVSGSGLLVQADTATLQEITEAYYSVELSNRYHDQIVEMSMGIASAIGGVENSRAKYTALLGQRLGQLEPELKAIVDRGKGMPKT